MKIDNESLLIGFTIGYVYCIFILSLPSFIGWIKKNMGKNIK
jgi:hypothetical protein